MTNIIYLLFFIIIIFNVYIIFNQYQLFDKYDIKPLIPMDFKKLISPIKKQLICDEPNIINDIKLFYKKSAIKNNDFNSEISHILNLNLIDDETSNLYCDVSYMLNNNIEGNRRFTITKNGDIINMGRPNTATTV